MYISEPKSPKATIIRLLLVLFTFCAHFEAQDNFDGKPALKGSLCLTYPVSFMALSGKLKRSHRLPVAFCSPQTELEKVENLEKG